MEPKQVIVMRTDLSMRKGKMIAQGAHASMKVLLDRATVDGSDSSGGTWSFRADPTVHAWLSGRFTKVCLRVESEADLRALHEEAARAGLPCALVIDAGKTEFHGVPTPTCCAIGPAPPSDIDRITGHLRLL